MRNIFIVIFFFSLTFIGFSCGRIEQKAKHYGEKVKHKGEAIFDTAINKILPDVAPETFSIRSIVTDFKNDSSIKEIKGIQTDYINFYTEYCVYVGKKSRVLKGVNKIIPIETKDFYSGLECLLSSKKYFDERTAPFEKSENTNFFFKFDKLKSYEIYSCIKAPNEHFIIFDKNSDTVYHRIGELRD